MFHGHLSVLVICTLKIYTDVLCVGGLSLDVPQRARELSSSGVFLLTTSATIVLFRVSVAGRPYQTMGYVGETKMR